MSANHTIKEDLIQSQILQAAQQLFQKHGFQKVTMDDVAKAIGKGRSSLYYYYKSKDEIFDAVIDAEIREAVGGIGRAMDKESSIEEKIRAFCLARITVTRKRKAFFEGLEAGMNADEMSQYAQKKLLISRRILGEQSMLLRQAIISAVSRGELPPLESQRMEATIFVLMGSLRGLKQEMIFENSFTHMETAVDALTRMTIQELRR